ncbi:MAG: hypothetical protein NC931_05610 [Candidatus Omnitrophica bacterium]|nr:hypothetical protein [Candidatus Omnitrophota bacterium]
MVIILYCKNYIAVIIAICILFVIYPSLVRSQENRENVKPGSDGNVIFIERSEGDKDITGGEKVQVFIGNDDNSKFTIKSRESEPSKKEPGKNDSERRTRKRELNQDNKMPFVNVKDTEQRQKGNEKAIRNAGFRSENTINSLTAPKQESQNQPGQKQDLSMDKGLQRYMDIITKKNLFLPLGSGAEAPKPTYALTAVISSTTNKPQPKAIIEQIGTNRSFYVSVGETFADDAKVVEISEREAKVERSGEEIKLSLGFGFQGGERKGPRDFREQRGEQRQPSGERRSENRQMGTRITSENFNPNDIPPFVRKMLEDRGISIEELQSNPDLREKLRSEFMQRFRGGGAPQEVAPAIIEAPSR